ncbi:MAG: response regulator [Patescibacteria group bacterium]
MAKILVVEDEIFLSEALTNKLRKTKHTVETAMDGVQALAKVGPFKPELILLDIRMPKKDGFSVIRELKSAPATKDIPVIMLSNFGEANEVTKAKALGAQDYFVKANLKLADLCEKIKNLLG